MFLQDLLEKSEKRRERKTNADVSDDIIRLLRKYNEAGIRDSHWEKNYFAHMPKGLR